MLQFTEIVGLTLQFQHFSLKNIVQESTWKQHIDNNFK